MGLEFIQQIFNISPFYLAHLFLVVILVFHVVFSVVLLRQAQRMIRVVEANISPVIFTLAIVHLAVSIVTVFVAISLL